VGGAILLVAAYFLVDRRLHFRDRADRRSEDDRHTAALRTATLRLVHGELQSAASLLETFAGAVRSDSVPYPVLDTNGWTLLSQANVIVTLKPATAHAVTLAYNRIRSANAQLSDFADLTVGPTAAMVNAAIGASATGDKLPPLAQDAYDQYQARRRDLRLGIPQRLGDLRSHLDAAIDAIEDELGASGIVPSSQRDYVGTPGSVSDLRDITG
jgi:hypothetical protein